MGPPVPHVSGRGAVGLLDRVEVAGFSGWAGFGAGFGPGKLVSLFFLFLFLFLFLFSVFNFSI